MDFSLLQPDENFHLGNYFDAIIAEFHTLGREISITRKEKRRKHKPMLSRLF
jgi:hypothetical protein